MPNLGHMEVDHTWLLPSRSLQSNRERQVGKQYFQHSLLEVGMYTMLCGYTGKGIFAHTEDSFM